MEVKKVFTCPSKVLIMGGYAILSEQCFGLTVGLNERFFTYLTESNSNKEEQEIVDDNVKMISFYSKQISSEWHYKLKIKDSSCEDVSSSPNPFLESIVRVLAYSIPHQQLQRLSKTTSVFIYHESGFYSKNSQVQQDDQLDQQKQKTVGKYNFQFPRFDKDRLNKTGLGSSACVLVATLGALLDKCGEIKLSELHFLAQKANYLAQKKIGSGFDIATSVFGSQVYKRFSPLAFSENPPAVDWEHLRRFSIPSFLKVIMVDLCCGSDTRVLAGSIKKYLDSHEKEAELFYNQSNSCVEELQCILADIKDEEKLRNNRNKIADVNKKYRLIFKDIGVQANVETEPDTLTQILDTIIQTTESVIYAVCPGAGGYDAICLLVDNTFELKSFQKNLDEIKTTVKNITDIIAKEIGISQEGFRPLTLEESDSFFESLL